MPNSLPRASQSGRTWLVSTNRCAPRTNSTKRDQSIAMPVISFRNASANLPPPISQRRLANAVQVFLGHSPSPGDVQRQLPLQIGQSGEPLNVA